MDVLLEDSSVGPIETRDWVVVWREGVLPTIDLSKYWLFHTFTIFEWTATKNSRWHVDLFPEGSVWLFALALDHSDLAEIAVVGLI